MPYDKTKDDVVSAIRATDPEKGKSWIEVVLARYDGGDIKIGINRCVIGKDGDKTHVRRGRLTLDEARAVAEAMQELLMTDAAKADAHR